MGLFMHPPHFRTKTMTFVVMAMTLWTCRAADPVELHGSGTTNPSKYFWKVMDLFEERAKIPLYMTYRAVGSSTGMAEFIGEDNPDGAFTAYNHFGSGDVPMKSSLFPSLAANSRSMVHIPFVMGAIAIFHSVPESNFGTSGEVDLDACLLAKIFPARSRRGTTRRSWRRTRG
jgi:ABC-type phosphate transport system substrate-binding protein